MCGVFGAFARDGRTLDVGRLAAATNLLGHRGPDGGGVWAEDGFFLGHRRLAIVDLSPAAAQPMTMPERGLVTTFNGEIYNHQELREELRARGHTFRTRSDTEVLLRAFAEWREEMLGRLRGMFAFAIVDTRAQSLFLARDRFGEKPLFIHETAGRILFASETRPIAACIEERSVDPVALGEYLCLNYVPGDRVMLAGTCRLPPGTHRTYSCRGVSGGRYYRPGDVTISIPATFGETLGELRARVDDATRMALRADVPVALFLSGGLDSSLTAESATRQGKLSHAFCLDVATFSYSEWDRARFVATRLGLTLHRVVLGAESLDELPRMVEHADDPLGDSSMLAVWCLAKEAARSFKVVLSGDGGDELLAGYLTYRATRLFSTLVDRAPRAVRAILARTASRLTPGSGKVTRGYQAMRFLRAAELPAAEAHFTFNGSFLPESAADLVTGVAARGAARSALAEMCLRHDLGARPELHHLQRADATDYLPNDILAKVDRMTMAHGLESRAPLLDANLADFSLTAAERWEGGWLTPPKRLFRGLAHRIYGSRVSRAPKKGFSIPVHDWLRGAGRSMVGDVLSQASLDAVPVLDGGAVVGVRDRFFRGEQLGFEIWGLVVLVEWYRRRIARGPEVMERPHTIHAKRAEAGSC
jgi:asparagine synthase (glutamine-hydrolysing)